MNEAFLQRAFALAAAAFLAALLAVGLSDGDGRSEAKGATPRPAVGAGGGWATAVAGVAAPAPRKGRPTACGWVLTPRTLGVVHPVLPCGAKLFLDYGGQQVLTRVVARGPVPRGRALDVTPALAKLLRLQGERELRWAFAR